MTDPSIPTPDERFATLGRALERAFRKLEKVDERVTQLAEVVLAVAERETVGETSDKPSKVAGPGVRSWLLADDPEQADADLDDLTVWVWRVYLWFPDAWLSSCWLWHPEVIEELWWLRVAHAEAFEPPTGSTLRVGDWHDRQRPGVARRVRSVLTKCELSRHAPVNGRPVDITPPSPPALARHAPAVALVWSAGADLDAVRAAGPEPTAEQLTEADAYQRALYRSQR
jgi:hypothetical protein